MELRPYQVEAIEATRERFRAGARRVLIVCPTGGGKTIIASEVIRSAVAKGSRVLFLAHRRELILQTCDKLNRFGVPHGVVMAGHPSAPQRAVQVASVQTLLRRRGQLTKLDLIFLDEAHHVTPENGYGQLLEWFPAARAVGLTATPWRLDGRGLADVFDGYVLARTPRELRDDGFLVPVGGWEYEAIDTTRARVQRGDFVTKDLEKAATSQRVVGDVVKEWCERANGCRTVLFAVSIEHSQLMVQAFRAQGGAAEHVDGEMDTSERDAILARLRSGETRLVCNCNVLTEGFDCPELECCVLARPTLSTSLYLQMVGRVLRPAPGKTMARLHDHAGCLAAHGHPYAERDYNPEVSRSGPRNKKEADGGEEAKRLCPKCRSVLARWPCDACGYSPTPQERARQLVMEAEAKRKAIRNDPDGPFQRKQKELEKNRSRWKLVYADNPGLKQ